ncbi:MAG: hypothetical protein IT260_19220 [Saprospiraceae bacterium]|nr:hypothetical protein [Saprospiraceae bacterium]
MRNELDQWLRQHADPGTDQPAPDGWDTPSGTVWAGVRAGLDQRRKRRRRFLFWLFFLAGLAGTGLWLGDSLTPAAKHLAPPMAVPERPAAAPNPKQPAVQAEQLSRLKATGAALPPAGRLLPAAADSKIKNPSTAATRVQNQIASRQPDPASQNTGPKSSLQPLQAEAAASADPIVPAPLPGLAPENTVLTDGPRPASAGLHAPALQTLPGHWPPLAGPAPASPPLPPSGNAPIRPLPQPNRLYVAATAGLRFTTRSLQGPGNAKPKGRESGAWVREVGLCAGWQVQPHWAIETGLQRTAIRLQAERVLNFRYRTNTEQFDNQNFAYRNSDEEKLETSFGQVDLRMDLSREPNRPIDDQAAVALSLRTDEQVNYWSIPLLLRRVQHSGRWQWSLSAGIGLHLEAGYQVQVQAARANRPGIRNIQVRLQGRANGLSPLFWDARLGAGLQYRLSPRASIALAPEFRYGLSSIYRRGPFRSLTRSGGITAGLAWQF